MSGDGYNHLNDCDEGTHWGAPEPRWSRCSCCGKHLHEMSQEHAPERTLGAAGPEVDPIEEITEEDRRWAMEEQARHVNADPLRWRG